MSPALQGLFFNRHHKIFILILGLFKIVPLHSSSEYSHEQYWIVYLML